MNGSLAARLAIEKMYDLFFPRICLHCDEILSGKRSLFCECCTEGLCLIDANHRCPFCFQEIERSCPNCKDHPYQVRIAAALENHGAGGALFREACKYPELHKSLSSFIVLQMMALKFPMPDIVLSLPSGIWSHFFSEYQMGRSLANEVAKILSAPFEDVIRRKSLQMPGEGEDLFVWKKKIDISDKVVLIVSDKLEVERLRLLCQRIGEGCPKEIFAISFLD